MQVPFSSEAYQSMLLLFMNLLTMIAFLPTEIGPLVGIHKNYFLRFA
jgi:hypothetical protein